jgi:hypothetical protein
MAVRSMNKKVGAQAALLGGDKDSSTKQTAG